MAPKRGRASQGALELAADSTQEEVLLWMRETVGIPPKTVDKVRFEGFECGVGRLSPPGALQTSRWAVLDACSTHKRPPRDLRPAAAGCCTPAALAVAAPAPFHPIFLPYFPFQISPPRRPAPLEQLAAKWEENGEIMDGRTVLEADEALLERTGCAPTVARRLVEAARANDFAFATQASAWACLGVHVLCTRC